MKESENGEAFRRVAVITGASSGIGEAFARRLAGEGYDLVLVARRKDLLLKLAGELSRSHQVFATVLAADLSTEAGILQVTQKIGVLRRIDFLINSAGFGTRGFFSEVEPGKIHDMINLHAMATAFLTRAALPRMLANKKGCIINVSSIGAFLTTSHYVVYSATKAFVNMFCRGLRDELAGTGVKVQALCPGLTRTGFMFTDEFKHFNYGDIPSFAWMAPDRVVEESLAALRKSKVVVIPGFGNRIFVGALKAPIIGPALGGILSLMGRGRNAY